jgi:RNA polymerase sigma-70 factor (ECF subfamily)
MTDNFISKSLVEEVAKGNIAAFRKFYDQAYPAAYKFVGYFLPVKEDCEEVLSEVFFTVWKRRVTLTEIENLKSWLYIVCRNETFRYLKRERKYRGISIDDMPVDLHIDPSAADRELVESEMFEHFRKAVEELPERCKLIFLMVREEKMKHGEIAEILAIAEGTVAQQMNKAIGRITKALRKYYPIHKSNKK